MKWIEGHSIGVRIDGGTAIVSANREGLLSLANCLSELADSPAGSHFHLDEYNALEDGSTQLILEKTRE